MQKLNLPNKLTLIRMFLAPIYLALMLIEFPYHYIVALAVFAVASLTDMLDGKIARKNNLITVFGKLLDPLADKMLTTPRRSARIYARGLVQHLDRHDSPHP